MRATSKNLLSLKFPLFVQLMATKGEAMQSILIECYREEGWRHEFQENYSTCTKPENPDDYQKNALVLAEAFFLKKINHYYENSQQGPVSQEFKESFLQSISTLAANRLQNLWRNQNRWEEATPI